MTAHVQNAIDAVDDALRQVETSRNEAETALTTEANTVKTSLENDIDSEIAKRCTEAVDEAMRTAVAALTKGWEDITTHLEKEKRALENFLQN